MEPFIFEFTIIILICMGFIAAMLYIFHLQRKARKATLLRLEEMTKGYGPAIKQSSFNKLTEAIDSQVMRSRIGAKLFSGLKKGTQRKNEIKPAHIIFINIALFILANNISSVVKVNVLVLMVSLIALEGMALLYAISKQKKIKDLMEAELPQILETIGRVYKVHPDLRVAIMEVCQHIREPLVKERFENIIKLSRFGYTVEEAMRELSKELKSTDLDFVVTSIQINTPLGGDLSGLFERMADILRKRKATDNEINNVMFQNKISAMISAAFVPAIVCIAFAMNSNTKKYLIIDPTGRIIFIACIFWWIIGLILIRRVTRIKI